MSRQQILTFANDWRDTIYYSLLAVYAIGRFFVVAGMTLEDIYGTFSWGFFFREMLRMCAWATFDRNKNAVWVLILSFNFLEFMIYASGYYKTLFHEHDQILILTIIIQCANLAFLLWLLPKVGGYRGAFKIWWNELFDWPRKQNPPKRWDSVGAKLKRFVEKFLPDFVPSPVGI